MKSKLYILIILFFSQKIVAQSPVVQPEAFRLPKIIFDPICPLSDAGKIFYYTPSNTVKYCGDDYLDKNVITNWEGTSDIYYMGKVGIRKDAPSEELDLYGNARFNTLAVNGRIGLNTNTPVEKLDIVNRRVNIKSTADEKLWSLAYLGSAGRFDFREVGSTRMNISAGGNVGINAVATNDKLSVQGDVNYNSSLSVEGKGILANTYANQLVMYPITASTGEDFYINNNTCKIKTFSFNHGNITQAPAVIQGQKIAGNNIDNKLVISIENVTSTGGAMRFCNNSGGDITLVNAIYSLILIGQ